MRFASLLVKIPSDWTGCLSSSCEMSVRILKCAPKDSERGQSLLQTDADPALSQGELARRTRTVGLERRAKCKLMTDSGCFMDSASSRDDGLMQWKVIAPNAGALRSLVEKVTDLGCTVGVEKISVLRTASELTVAQERVLQMAYELGYFEIPRKITLDQLAGQMEISKATLNVTLRRAQRKLVASHIGESC